MMGVSSVEAEYLTAGREGSLPRNGSVPVASLINSHDWSRSSLGDARLWPSALRSICSLTLDSKFPMFVAWGDALNFVYNDAYAELLGDKHPAAMGARFNDVWCEIWTEIGPLVERAMSGEAIWIEDHPLKVHRHGYVEDAWFTFSYSPARDDDGRIAGMFCAVTETTARVLAEAALRDLNETLEARVEERSVKLQLAEEQLRQSQKFEAIAQLTGGIAHDFNNLLTVICGSVDLLCRDSLDDIKRRRYLDAIRNTADRAVRLTSQMLAFARRQTLKPRAFDARTGLAEIVDMIRSVVGPGIVLELQLPDDPCCILADRGQFDTAIINMVLNARDAMNGEGCLTFVAEPRSSIPTTPPVLGDFLAVTIADTGAGIAEADLDRIFEPFFTTRKAGTGLGLSQAIGFAKQSGGDICVTSMLGCGTSFTIYLPRTSALASDIPEPSIGIKAIDGGGRRVLIVEDNDAVGSFAHHALTEFGFESALVSTAERALAVLASDPERFDVIFSDIVMPGMSGLELANAVEQLYPKIPIVLATGYSDVVAQSGAQGIALLRKPYSIEELAFKLVAASEGRVGFTTRGTAKDCRQA